MGESRASGRPRVAEFFAGIGLVRAALDSAGFETAWANDIEAAKLAMYQANYDAELFRLGDVREVAGADLPDVELATASFPCTDLSLAGNRAGLAGVQSSMLWEFTRILEEMKGRKPAAVLLENVPSFATSHGGSDFRAAISKLNELGYTCDVIVMDARWFVPQSRPRLFVIGTQVPITGASRPSPSPIRPGWISEMALAHPELKLAAAPIEPPHATETSLSEVVERLKPSHDRWWDVERTARFEDSLSPIQTDRLARMKQAKRKAWATAYRRTRNGRAVWEMRPDTISGCLRTARGGSSKQALVEAGRGEFRVRWMTPREYARLQGAPHFKLGSVSDNQALFGFGDAVCVPVIEWIATNYLQPLLAGQLLETEFAQAA